MSQAPAGQSTVEVTVRLPADVADWLAERGVQAFKTRPGYIRDLLVTAYRKALEAH